MSNPYNLNIESPRNGSVDDFGNSSIFGKNVTPRASTPQTFRDYPINRECPPTPIKTPSTVLKRKRQNQDNVIFIQPMTGVPIVRKRNHPQTIQQPPRTRNFVRNVRAPPMSERKGVFFSPAKNGSGQCFQIEQVDNDGYDGDVKELSGRLNFDEDEMDQEPDGESFEEDSSLMDFDRMNFPPLDISDDEDEDQMEFDDSGIRLNKTVNMSMDSQDDEEYNDLSSVEKVPFFLNTNELNHDNPFSPDKRMFNTTQDMSTAPGGNNNSIQRGSGGVRQIQLPGGKRVVNTYYSRYMEDFEELETLGSGSFGKVCKCRNRYDGMLYAVKQLNRAIKGRHHSSDMMREVHALALLADNPYIVRYYCAWIEDDRLFIQTEFCEGGNLYRMFMESYGHGRRIPERILKDILMQVCKGLHMMHAQNMVHLDIKPENIFIDGKNYKMGDLGLVASSMERDRDENEGDCRYLCREILNPQTNVNLKAVDIFALGATILELMCGKPLPQNGPSWVNIREGKIPWVDHVSRDFQVLIRQMLSKNPLRRPTAAQIIQHKVLTIGKPTYEQLLERVYRLERLLEENSKVEENLRKEIAELEKGRIDMQEEDVFSTSI